MCRATCDLCNEESVQGASTTTTSTRQSTPSSLSPSQPTNVGASDSATGATKKSSSLWGVYAIGVVAILVIIVVIIFFSKGFHRIEPPAEGLSETEAKALVAELTHRHKMNMKLKAQRVSNSPTSGPRKVKPQTISRPIIASPTCVTPVFMSNRNAASLSSFQMKSPLSSDQVGNKVSASRDTLNNFAAVSPRSSSSITGPQNIFVTDSPKRGNTSGLRHEESANHAVLAFNDEPDYYTHGMPFPVEVESDFPDDVESERDFSDDSDPEPMPDFLQQKSERKQKADDGPSMRPTRAKTCSTFPDGAGAAFEAARLSASLVNVDAYASPIASPEIRRVSYSTAAGSSLSDQTGSDVIYDSAHSKTSTRSHTETSNIELLELEVARARAKLAAATAEQSIDGDDYDRIRLKVKEGTRPMGVDDDFELGVLDDEGCLYSGLTL